MSRCTDQEGLRSVHGAHEILTLGRGLEVGSRADRDSERQEPGSRALVY